MLVEWKNSIIGEIEKRFKNPFLGAFSISWLFWNWKFIYILFFIDEKYVSLEPTLNDSIKFITKLEYIQSLNIINVYHSLLYPIVTSILFVLAIEWGTTILIIGINGVKNSILKHEKLTKSESRELQNTLKTERNKYLEMQSLNNQEILSLQNKISEYEGTIEQKVAEKLQITENKNIKRMKELEDNLRKSEIVSSERLEKNNVLEKENKKYSEIVQDLKNSERKTYSAKEEYLKMINELTQQNNELSQRMETYNKPLDAQYQEEYAEFQQSFFFQRFDSLIDKIESNRYRLTDSFSGKDIKFLEVKGIIQKIEDGMGNTYYQFTTKGDKFVEYFLDNYDGRTDIDVPF